MPRGTPEVAERGKNTRFSGERAVEAGRKGAQARIANLPIRKCLKNIATEALYGHPPLPAEQLKQIAKFFAIATKEVTFAHVAIWKQTLEMSKGDVTAFNLVAAYAGEKPAENINITASDFTELNEAFDALKGDDAE